MASILNELWLLVAIGIFTVILLAALSNLSAASGRIEEEQSRTAAERDAFEAFAKRIQQLSPDTMQSAQGTEGAVVAAATSVSNQPGQLAKVREAYRETIMAVPHYDEEYGEPLIANIAMELGEDIAASFEGNHRLSPMFQQALVAKSMNAVAERERLLGWLSDEAGAVDDARKTLKEINSELADYDSQQLHGADYPELLTRYDRLDELQERCDEVAQQRQRALHNREVGKRGIGQQFIEYLYSQLEVDHPVLADVTTVHDRIESARHAVARAATRLG